MSDDAIHQHIRQAPILIVDDNPTNITLVHDVLQHAGFMALYSEADARRVAARCREQSFDLVLLDIRMPHMDGFQVIESIRPLFVGDYLPIIVLTAQTDTDTRRRALSAGVRDFLTKPIVSWELLQRVHNMLEVRQLYRQLDAQNQDLERRVAARTQELSGALVAARQADRAKLDFLAMISHELRTPLNAIIGFAQELDHHPTLFRNNPDYGEYVKMIEDSGYNLLSMVNNILDFTRGATGTIVLQEKTLDLHELMRYVATLLRAKAQERGVRVSVNVAHDTPLLVRADERRLREMLLGVLDNAIKFNHPGGAVTLDSVATPEVVVVEVRDDGPGIPPDVQMRLFEPFAQGDGALQRRFEGIGLGLALVRRFAEMHQGTVAVESRCKDHSGDPSGTQGDSGTTLRIILPGTRVVADPQDSPSSSSLAC